MAVDAPTPMASVSQFNEGPFANLTSGFSPQRQNDLMIQATRACESVADRRFAPFTNVVESQRADALDIEDALDSYVPLDPTSQLGFSRAMSLGSTLLVRHCWVRERPARYPEYWSGSIASIDLRRSFSGVQQIDVTQIQYEQDTGHVRFQLGSFIPSGTTLVITYSGGYSTMPADLSQACVYMAASIAVRELDPIQSGGHDPDLLRTDALDLVAPYLRF